MSRTDEVVDGIRTMILDGRLKAGSRLPIEKDLAVELGVSRGSLREGVRALSVLGVLETRQGDGTYVTSLDPAVLLGSVGFVVDLNGPGSAKSFHAVRRLLETEAAGLAASRIDQAGLDAAGAALVEAGKLIEADPDNHEALMECDISFHRSIAEGCGEPVLTALIEALVSRTLRGRLWRALTEEGADSRTHREHLAVLAALQAHDPDRARIRMAVHLLGVQEFVDSVPAVDIEKGST
jgi:DNA-binding FadR family transcriptional regulator